MAASTITAQQILVRAVRMLNIFSEQFEDIPGHIETQALEILNENLGAHGALGLQIPFYDETTLALIANENEYDVLINTRPIVQLLFVNIIFPNSEQRYLVDIILPGRLYKRNYSFDSKSRPQEVILKRSHNNSTLIFYPVPDQAYTVEIKAKITLEEVEPKDTFLEVPIFWHKFLRYELARELKNFYPKATWTVSMENEYQRLKRNTEAATTVDLSPNIDNALLSKGNYSIRNGVWP